MEMVDINHVAESITFKFINTLNIGMEMCSIKMLQNKYICCACVVNKTYRFIKN